MFKNSHRIFWGLTLKEWIEFFLLTCLLATLAFLVSVALTYMQDRNEAKRLQELQQLVKEECGRRK